MRARPREAGTTLLELLVAIAIFAAVASAAYLALDQSLAFEQRLKHKRETWRRLDAVYALLQSDLKFAARHALPSAEAPPLAFAGFDRAGTPAPALLFRFTRGQNSMQKDAAAPYQQIAYRWRDGALLREVRSMQAAGAAQAGDEALLLDEVAAIRVRYFVPGGAWANRWPDSLAAQDPTVLPGALELVFELAGRQSYRWLFHVGPPR